jgi:hypothetical protein
MREYAREHGLPDDYFHPQQINRRYCEGQWELPFTQDDDDQDEDFR